MKTRRSSPASPRLACRAALGAAGVAQQDFGSPELIEAAKKEGKLVYYTANFTEVEQEVIKAFNKRFPCDQGRDGARAGRPAHHPRQDRGRGRQAARPTWSTIPTAR